MVEDEANKEKNAPNLIKFIDSFNATSGFVHTSILYTYNNNNNKTSATATATTTGKYIQTKHEHEGMFLIFVL